MLNQCVLVKHTSCIDQYVAYIFIIGHNPRCGSKKNDSSDDDGCDLSTSFYLKIVWTSAAEFPGN